MRHGDLQTPNSVRGGEGPHAIAPLQPAHGESYIWWMRRYIQFCGRRHPRDLGPTEISTFLTHLAVDLKVSASTQNQALQSLLFLYREVLGVDLPLLNQVVRATRPKRLPVVLTQGEVRRVFQNLQGATRLVTSTTAPCNAPSSGPFGRQAS
jgi:integrase